MHRITVPTPFPVGPVNLYLILEPELTLIDAGPLTAEARESLERQLGEHNISVSALKRIVLTHSHQDHYGLAAELARRSGAPAYADRLEHAFIRHDRAMRDFQVQLMEEGGTPPNMMDKMGQLFSYLQGVSEALENVLPLDEMPPLRCGNAVFEMVPVPGHTPGSIALWEPQRRILIAGDAVIENITPNPFSAPDPAGRHGRFRSLGAYWDTFDRIRAMNTAEIHAGHGEPVRDFPAYYDWSLGLHRRRQQAIVDALRDTERTAHEVAEVLFPEVVRHGSFLALTEVVSHLDLLEEEGRVHRTLHAGGGTPVAIYRAV